MTAAPPERTLALARGPITQVVAPGSIDITAGGMPVTEPTTSTASTSRRDNRWDAVPDQG